MLSTDTVQSKIGNDITQLDDRFRLTLIVNAKCYLRKVTTLKIIIQESLATNIGMDTQKETIK